MFKIQDTYNIIIVISLKITNICPYWIGYWYRLYFLPAYQLSVYRLKVISVQHYLVLGQVADDNLKNSGSCHHISWSINSKAMMPLDGKSAGFNFPVQCLHTSLSLSLRISSTLC